MSEVEARAPEFLWWPYIRKGNLNLLRGNASTGKTTFLFALITALSHGKQPFGMPGRLEIDEPMDTIYLGDEDAIGEYRFMLDNSGADVGRVHMFDYSKVDKNDENTCPPTIADIDRLRKMIRRFNAKLIVFDPIQSFIPADVDMNRMNQVRPLTNGLRELMYETGASAIFLEHLNKAAKMDNLYRGSGSQDIFNTMRSVLITGWTPDGIKAVGHLKSNGAPAGETILFEIVDPGRLIWNGGDSSIGGGDILTVKPGERQHKGKDEVLMNPYGLLAQALVEKTGHWEGTASEAVSQAPALFVGTAHSPTAFGSFMNNADLSEYGVRAVKRKTSRGAVYTLTVIRSEEINNSERAEACEYGN